MRRRILIIVVLLAVAGVGSVLVFNRAREANAPLRLYGNIDVREVDLAFQVGGQVQRLAVDEGEAVRAGAVLGELDPATLQSQLREAEASTAALQARLQRLQAGNTRAQIGQSQAQVAEQRAALQNAQADVDRLRPLQGTGAVPDRDVENAVSRRDEAAARLRAAQQALADVQAGSRAEDIQQAQADIERSRAQAEQIRIRLGQSVLRAPSDGVVLTRAVEPGAIVQAGATAFTLSLTRPVWARIYVDAENLGLMAPGATVRLTTDAAPDKVYTGRVGYVSPTAEFTPKTVETPELRTDLVYRARVVVLNPDNRLRQGMPVTVQLAEPAEPRR